MKKDNVILIGMPGSGKSTCGVVLAKVLGYNFVDSDIVIQEKEGKLLCEIIEEKGRDGFVEVENRINSELEVERSVVATGGSVVYGEEAMKHLGEIGTIVYLSISYEELETRLGSLVNRGVALREGQTLLDLYEERIVLYERYADITIDENGLDVKDTVKLIEERLKS